MQVWTEKYAAFNELRMGDLVFVKSQNALCFKEPNFSERIPKWLTPSPHEILAYTPLIYMGEVCCFCMANEVFDSVQRTNYVKVLFNASTYWVAMSVLETTQ